ncbi:lipopolysaccharide biosynthesis protein [Haloarcula sp. 1CSR25-25]|uniref:lipopolysaccharide biosynthesis protein n=1 Tax=Haloarcula sp. 1CSR25-25 TaxID=2862545 RepID=UPI0028960432|nr:lipopolysaccharide biosynthesis protein [Haloarcula sp. 1CSR25-25]MDT3435467.1 lipopolysaccharide biosynthesis protein [Haloarcula sp. 1CSR25-25]
MFYLKQLLLALKRFVPTGDIAERATKSAVWLGVMNVIERGLQLVTMLVLARLLNPRAFGIFGISLLTVTAIKRFTDIGINAALIQHSDKNVDKYLNTTWILEVARGGAIAGVLALAAPLFATFFGEPRATGPLRVIALTPLFLGLRNPGIVYFKKNLEFHKEFVYRLSGSFTLPVVGIGIAFVSPTAWALVVGFVAADLVRLVASFIIHDYRPHLEFDIEFAKELIDYGKWITGSSIMSFLTTEGDDIVVGYLLPASSLAFYQLAYRFANAPATEISQTITNVAFPMYSKFQDDSEMLRESFFRTLQTTSLVAFPVSFGIVAVAPTFVLAFLGPDWLPMVWTLQILAVYGLLRAFGKLCGSIWKATGRPDYLTKLPPIRIILMGIFIFPAINTFGLEGAALVILGVSVFPMIPLNFYLIVDTIETTYRRLLYELAYPTIASGVMLGAVLAVRLNVPIASIYVEFFVLVGVGVMTYLCAVAVLSQAPGWDIVETIQFIRKKL